MINEITELGALNKRIYECISPDIDTERVIITDKQLDHIADHHPEAYDETLIELKTTLKDPDYIIKDDKHIDTGLVIKSIPYGNEHLHIVLKICTDSQNGKLANSIISGWKISEARLRNYLRNKTVLYKKE